MSSTVGRWRKRDSTPIGAKSERKVPTQVPSRTEENKLLATLHETILTGYYVGSKGETYELHLLESDAANSSTWSCIRSGCDGSSKKFTIWFDEATQRVWWGSWTYYFDPAEAAVTGTINWYKLGPGKGFEWYRDTTEVEEEELPLPQNDIKGYSLPGTGVVAVSADFKFQPPPGLEQPSELQLFTELPGERISTLEDRKEEKDHKADDETSAGTAQSPHDTDSEPSEVDERPIHSTHWTSRKPERRIWQVKGEKKAEETTHLRAPGARRTWR